MSRKVLNLLSAVELGGEREHLKELTRLSDRKGSDVNLVSGELRDNSAQVIPYPAFAWQWSPVQSYAWHNAQHINVLEYLAFFNYIRCMVNQPNNNGLRFVHIVDSRVISCVITKGRSSSVVLNRVARRVAALLLASNLYPKPLWTISAWNFADHGSRAVAQARSQDG